VRAPQPLRAARHGGTVTASSGGDPALSVTINNASDGKSTVVLVKCSNRPGVLHAITTTFKDLALNVNKAEVDMDGDLLAGARRAGTPGVAPPSAALTLLSNAFVRGCSGHACRQVLHHRRGRPEGDGRGRFG
jgi:hypothetical protein